jgi:hypothetical protein
LGRGLIALGNLASRVLPDSFGRGLAIVGVLALLGSLVWHISVRAEHLPRRVTRGRRLHGWMTIGALIAMMIGGVDKLVSREDRVARVVPLEQTFCNPPTRDWCFNATELRYFESVSTEPGRSDYSFRLTGYWSGPFFDGMTDLWWLFRFDAFETSSVGRRVHLVSMVPGELTTARHDEYGQPPGMGVPSFSTLALALQRGRTPGAGNESIGNCGGGCIGPWETPER